MFKDFHDVSLRQTDLSYVPVGDKTYTVYPYYKNPQCPVETLQGAWEFPAFLSIFKEFFKDKGKLRIVEIGSLFGGTLWHWMQIVPAGSFITSIDMLIPPEDSRYQRQKDGHDFLWKRWADEKSISLKIFSDSRDPEVIRQVSQDGPIDFLLIDGDHTYEGAKQDFVNYGPLVQQGGMIMFHDILPINVKVSMNWEGVEVCRLWEEIKAASYVTRELYADRKQAYWLEDSMGIGIVYI
jgi:hypothetical protein